MVKKIIYSFLFFSLFAIVFSQEEIMTVETLKRKKEATLDIEVTKIKSTPLQGTIDEENKKIIFDFKELKAEAKRKKIRIDENNYDIFLVEKLDKLWENKNGTRKEIVQSKNLAYKVSEKNGEKYLEISYEVKPENIYIGIINKNTKSMEKVFKGELNTKITGTSKGIENFEWTVVGNDKPIIIEANHVGDYKSEPIIIKFSQKNVTQLDLFPIIATGSKKIWEKTNFNGYLPISSSIETVKGKLKDVNGKVIPQLKYRNSIPNKTERLKSKIYYHDILEDTQNKIAIGAYENRGKEYVEASLELMLDAMTVEQIKEYASKNIADSNGLVKIEYDVLDENNKIYLVIGSSNGDDFYNIPEKNITKNMYEINYPGIYIRKNKDKFEEGLEYDISQLKDFIINEEDYFNSNGELTTSQEYAVCSLGKIKIEKKSTNIAGLVPAIGIGKKIEWEYEGDGHKLPISKEIEDTAINIGKSISIQPYLTGYVTNGEAAGIIFKKLLNRLNSIDEERAITISKWNEKKELLTTELKIPISKDTLVEIRKYAYNRPEELVEIPYENNYKVSLIPSYVNNKKIVIPNSNFGNVREILYPKIKFRKKGNQSSNNGFSYNHTFREKYIREESFFPIDEDMIINLGTVEFYQNKTNSDENLSPMIALGKNDTSSDGYCIDGNVVTVPRNEFYGYFSVNKDLEKGIPLKIYFENIKGDLIDNNLVKNFNGGAHISRETNKYLGAWIYAQNRQEKVTADLIVKIPKDKKLEILKEIREYPKNPIQIKTDKQVSLVIGKYENGYKFPLDENKTIRLEISSLEVVKDSHTNNNVIIEFKDAYQKQEIVVFDILGNSNNENIKVDLNGGIFINGLPYNDGGTVEIDGASQKLILGDNKINIDKNGLNMDLIYMKDGLVKMRVNRYGNTDTQFKIIHREASYSNDIFSQPRREYTVTIKTPVPRFEVISKEELDFGTVFRGDNTKTAQAKIELKNLSGANLLLNSNTKKVDLKNGDSTIRAEIYDIGDPIKKENSEVYILEGKLIETQSAILEGEHRGTIILNIEVQ